MYTLFSRWHFPSFGKTIPPSLPSPAKWNPASVENTNNLVTFLQPICSLGNKQMDFLVFCTYLFYSTGKQHLREKCMKKTDLGEAILHKCHPGNHIIHSNLKSTCIELNISSKTSAAGFSPNARNILLEIYFGLFSSY